jgi:hypothetical protein
LEVEVENPEAIKPPELLRVVIGGDNYLLRWMRALTTGTRTRTVAHDGDTHSPLPLPESRTPMDVHGMALAWGCAAVGEPEEERTEDFGRGIVESLRPSPPRFRPADPIFAGRTSPEDDDARPSFSSSSLGHFPLSKPPPPHNPCIETRSSLHLLRASKARERYSTVIWHQH